MELVSFILICCLCGGFGILYTIFHKKVGWQGVILRGLAIYSVFMLALITANLKDLNNAMRLFLISAFALIIIQEVTLASNTIGDKPKKLVYAAFATISNTLIAVSAINFATFNVFSAVGGILVGLGLGFIVCAARKYRDVTLILSECLVYASIGLFFGFAIMGITVGTHFLSALLFLIGGVFMLMHRVVLVLFGDKYKFVGYITHALYYIALVLVALTIYFF